MSTTLNLSDCLLAMGRELQEQGRPRDALKLFTRLARFRDLPAETGEEVKARLAELLIAGRQYRKARRYLAVLMCRRPGHGRYFYLFAVALHRDPAGDSHRAVKYYEQALTL